MFNDIVEIKCPHCGNESRESIKFEGRKDEQFVTCDAEIGGCEQIFVIFLKRFIKLKTYKLISGEEE